MNGNPYFPCGTCGGMLVSVPLDEACLDERGYAHVVCGRCGQENSYLADTSAIEPTALRPEVGDVSGIIKVMLWVIVVGLLLLLLPTVYYEPAPEAKPDPLLFVSTDADGYAVSFLKGRYDDR